MTRLLAIADERSRSLTVQRLKNMKADLVVSCGDLPFDYLDFVASAANAPLLYVPGNHDPSCRWEEMPVTPSMMYERRWGDPPGPKGVNLDGQIVSSHGLTFAGLGGSIRYRPGPNQYTEGEMRRKVLKLRAKARWRAATGRGRVDVLVTHSPPRGLGDLEDLPHRGFKSFNGLVGRLEPKVMIHGHVHPHGFEKPDRIVGDARLINVIPFKMIEVET